MALNPRAGGHRFHTPDRDGVCCACTMTRTEYDDDPPSKQCRGKPPRESEEPMLIDPPDMTRLR
jgi:hypothetical protein